MNSFFIVGTISSLDTLHELNKNPQKLKGCDVVELRFDEHMELSEAKDAAKEISQHRPVLITIRTSKEGGTWKLDDAHRFEFFKEFFEIATYADIELKSELFQHQKRSDFPSEMTVIGSFHNYKKCPSEAEMNELIQQGEQWGIDIVKLAVFCNKADDRQSLSNVLEDHPESNLALMGMGPEGLETRFSLPPLGSKFTYGFLDKPAAPGQPSCMALAQKLK
ncbi:type I 3-dehydroquinate dehydratase [Lentisphaera profundi]|uniref:3-dehydroquinate dehydratase n=1 Tax=Lentisphaera profundi TaxID=1658616 RepID=A0ABY7VS99_9BACT|nr:type I 3-dehydroquinate dehydratase [Lentisphaera profundi]WDE96179.1 type I 3-dehydroquinate dehydratase [Lentisphaera profundi]